MNNGDNMFENPEWQPNENNAPFEDLMVKEARGTLSRYAWALFTYTAAAYLIVFAVNFLLGIIFINNQETLLNIANSTWYQWLIGVGPMYIVGFPIFFLIVRSMPKRTIKKTKLGFGEFAAMLLVAEAFMFAGNLIGLSLNATISAMLGKEVVNSTSELIENSPIWLIFIIVVIVGPIIEELLFRKLLIDRISKYGDVFAIIISSVAFGLFHGNFYQFFYATFLGLLLGYMYTKTGNNIYNTIMHMIINFLGSVLVLPIIKMQEIMLEISEKLSSAEIPIDEINLPEYIKSVMAVMSYTVVQYAMIISGAILLFRAIKYRSIKINRYPEISIPKHRVAETVLLNAGTIVFLLFSIFTFALNIFLV